MKVDQDGRLCEVSFAMWLAMVAVFVAAMASFLVLTTPSNASATLQDGAAGQPLAADAPAQSSTEDPSLPAAANVLAPQAPNATPAPTF